MGSANFRDRGQVAGGADPIAEEVAARAHTITLCEVLDDYLAACGDKLKPRTREQFRDLIKAHRKDGSPPAFADWRTSGSPTSRRNWGSVAIASSRTGVGPPGRTSPYCSCGC
jgi:hypothetical protein